MFVTLSLVFWASLAVCVYAYAGYPLLLRVWAAVAPARPEPSAEAPLPRVDLLISAYNEERVIGEKLANALAVEYPESQLRVVLISDGSSDDTVGIAQAVGDPRLVVLDFRERRGKDPALNDAFSRTDGEIIVFTDANTLYAREALVELVRPFADPEVGLVVGHLQFVSEAGDPVDGGLYWRFENRLKLWQDALGTVLVANGSIFAVRRELVGTLLPGVANDFQIPMEVGGRGRAIRFAPGAVAYEKTTEDQDEEFARKVRIVTQGFTGAWRLRRQIRGKRRFLFVSHKLLRWLAGFFQIVLFVASAALAPYALLYGLAFGAQAAFYLLALVGFGLRRNPHAPAAVRVPYYFCMVNAAAMLAAWRFLRGSRISMWEKAETAR